MNVAYCTAVFPCPSEAFIRRELAFLRSHGMNVSIWALKAGPGCRKDVPVVYRPARLSLDTLRAISSLVRTPRRALGLLVQIGKLTLRSPAMALQLLTNLHAVAFFARDARDHGIELVHGCFVNLPGAVAMGVSALTSLPLTAAGHARDVFVEGAGLPVIAARARMIVACNAAAAEHMRSRLSATDRPKLHVVYHGLKINTPQPFESAASDHEPLLLAVGRFVPKKGFELLVRAVATLRERGMPVRLVLVGQGPLALALHHLAEQLGVDDLLSWPGWLTEAATRQLMGEASVLVVPSVVAADGDRDGIPNVVLEAWAAGLPVIASTAGGLTEVICHDDNGLLVDPVNPANLAAAIGRLLSDRPLRERLSGSARDCLRERFNLDENANRLLDLFARACNGHGAA